MGQRPRQRGALDPRANASHRGFTRDGSPVPASRAGLFEPSPGHSSNRPRDRGLVGRQGKYVPESIAEVLDVIEA